MSRVALVFYDPFPVPASKTRGLQGNVVLVRLQNADISETTL